MRLTSFTDYTLRVLIFLGLHREGGGLATIGDIAASYGVSENHLMKVVHHLAKEGYIETTRGKGGGMRLARAPEQINLGQVIRGAEEEVAIVECFQPGNARCAIIPACVLKGVLAEAVREFFKVLDQRTLKDLLQPAPKMIRLLQAKRLSQGRVAFG